jgi:hypothetical protein
LIVIVCHFTKYIQVYAIPDTTAETVDYYLTRVGKRRAKTYQVHQNRLKAYYQSKKIDTDSNGEEEPLLCDKCKKMNPINKRIYIKNPNNARWNKNNTNVKIADLLSESESLLESELNTVDNSSECESSSAREVKRNKKKNLRRQKLPKKVTERELSDENEETFSKSIKIFKKRGRPRKEKNINEISEPHSKQTKIIGLDQNINMNRPRRITRSPKRYGYNN